MAFAGDGVGLFDSETWSNVGYEPLVDLFHQKFKELQQVEHDGEDGNPFG